MDAVGADGGAEQREEEVPELLLEGESGDAKAGEGAAAVL